MVTTLVLVNATSIVGLMIVGLALFARLGVR